jgi:hypothetical protein
MLEPDPDQELQTMCPVYSGSAIDRLAHWCKADSLQHENSVLEALAHCREVLHVLPVSTRSEDLVQVQAGYPFTGQASSCQRRTP